MKIDRRSFLSFVIGGAAGTALTPLPWKLTDDLSIWSQNWPWTPVPDSGEVTYVNSTCTLCPGGCGIAVRKVDDRVVKIEGIAGHPVNNGGVCVLGLAGPQLLYGPYRVRQPLKRSGSRGQNQWEPISWEAALGEVADKLNQMRAKNETNALACVTGAGRGSAYQLLARFLKFYGSPNLMTAASSADAQAQALRLLTGIDGQAAYDLENSTYVLSFGAGLLEGWGNPARVFRANSRRVDKAGKLIQAEPRLSNTAAKADKWLAIVPGSEMDLALGLSAVIIGEALYKSDVILNQTEGFEAFKAMVLEKYSTDKVATATGLDKSIIVALAREFAKAEKPLAVCGRGQGQTAGSLFEALAVASLNALVGGIGRSGGLWVVPLPESGDWPAVEMDAVATQAMAKPRLDGAGPESANLLHRLAPSIVNGKPYPLQMLLVCEANPYYTLPDSQTVKAAWDKIPFIVSLTSYLDETAQNADLILPLHTYLERYEDVVGSAGFTKPFIGLVRPATNPLYDTRHPGDVILNLAKAVGGGIAAAFAWEDYQACLEEAMGDKWPVLKEQGYWIDEKFKPLQADGALKTASGKLEMAAIIQQKAPLPIQGDEGAFPLVLVAYDNIRLAGNAIESPPFLAKIIEDTVLKGGELFVEVNPKTAQKLGIGEGARAELVTPKGKAVVRIHLYDGIRPDMVAMPRGLGHTGGGQYKFLAGKGLNFNAFIGPVEDPASGLDAAWGIRAKINRV
jgi:anaerobic selenocysteine-containing dehydrogenase